MPACVYVCDILEVLSWIFREWLVSVVALPLPGHEFRSIFSHCPRCYCCCNVFFINFAFGCNQAHAAICQNISAFIRSHALDIGMMLGNFQAKTYTSQRNMRGRSKKPTLGWLSMHYARFTLLLCSALRYTSYDCMCVLALTRDSCIFLVFWPLFFVMFVGL